VTQETFTPILVFLRVYTGFRVMTLYGFTDGRTDGHKICNEVY